MPRLSDLFSLNRRYSRSINLVRDLERPDSIEGYIPTTRAVEALRRILGGLSGTTPQRAWTLTGVYGTGKSAFAHYLTALCASAGDPMRQAALAITAQALGSESSEYQDLHGFPEQGLFRAVVVAQREPLSHTIVRALQQGSGQFWSSKKRVDIAAKLTDLDVELSGTKTIENGKVLELIKEVVETAKVPILFVIDELGKNLEFAAQRQGASDLYLLQQLAEMGSVKVGKAKFPVFVLGLLHQGFTDYGQRLATVQRNEWAKIQGRFEEISFTESPEQMMQLMAQAIRSNTEAQKIAAAVNVQSEEWIQCLGELLPDLSTKLLASIYPLHPLTGLALPQLCTRYAQNDRSLFTFLTSEEPFSFKRFLQEEEVKEAPLPTLKLHRLYDYFIEAVGSGLGSRPNMQRWFEIQQLVSDARYLDPDWVNILKTIGILNLITSTGALRASPEWVALAMCDRPRRTEGDRPTDRERVAYWRGVIDQIQEKGLVTHRRTMNELRLWEGSDFDVEREIEERVKSSFGGSLRSLLGELCPLKPVVAQRHSYETGTLRYFERRYLDASDSLTSLTCTSAEADGLIGYCIESDLSIEVPATTADGKPLVILASQKLEMLQANTLEYAALAQIQNAPQLRNDGVARVEVRQRLIHARQLLDHSLAQAFDVTQSTCWILGQPHPISHASRFNAKLSDLCDQVYNQGLILWNELINRRELTSQGAKARRELIEAMLDKASLPRLGLEGHGPEVSMYESLLFKTGIHRLEDEHWGFHPPQQTGVTQIWQSIEDFCLQAQTSQQSLDKLYDRLTAAPYGVKRGGIPVLLAAVLLHHVDDVSVYKDGTFVPVLGAEHFELLVKDPSRFAVKYFEIAGLRAQVFQELEEVLRSKAPTGQGIRNLTLLSVVKPLFQFVKKLPAHTRKTQRLSPESQAVLQTLLQAQEPDELLFTALPKAVGLDPIVSGLGDDGSTARIFRKKLVQALHEIQTCYERLVTDSQKLLYSAFGIRAQSKLREDLRVRSSYLVGQVLERSLRSFVLAAVDEIKPDQEWLESLLMIVADKPAESWSDEDVTRFEVNLSDLARRFKNLEALQSEVRASKKEGFEARRITITRPDGQETHRMVWMDEGIHATIQPMIDKILRECKDPQVQQALVTGLTEMIFATEEPKEVLGHRKPKQDPGNDMLRSHLK
ncbi:MAG: hypothetical protein HC921_07180 [Synechococcaceae cyanobacterium SM2_3_1]|nr:hypothetical protein [Synechococcaceae cyanobacterium SM2_3_1]